MDGIGKFSQGLTLNRAVTAATLAIVLTALAAGAAAQDFYQGKTISLYVGSGAGGAYDTYARLIARHYSRHIPGHPNLVVVDMPGAAGRKMIGCLYNVAPRDGTAIGTALSTLYFDPLIGADSTFDATKLGWIGSANKETSTCIVWHASPIRSIEEVRSREMAVGSSGPSSTDSIYPNVMNYLFGMKFKVIAGYTSAPLMSMAIEHGELDGRYGLTLSSLHSVNLSWTRKTRSASCCRSRSTKIRRCRTCRPSSISPRMTSNAVGGAEQDGTAVFRPARSAAGANRHPAPRLRRDGKGSGIRR